MTCRGDAVARRSRAVRVQPTPTAQTRELRLDAPGRGGGRARAGGRPGEFFVTLPGEHKLRTTVSLLVGDHSLSASAFVIRHPDENAEAFHRWLLRRNARLYGIAFAIDDDGDVYLVGRLPLRRGVGGTLDALLGAILIRRRLVRHAARDRLPPSIRREWAWRTCAASRRATSRPSSTCSPTTPDRSRLLARGTLLQPAWSRVPPRRPRTAVILSSATAARLAP